MKMLLGLLGITLLASCQPKHSDKNAITTDEMLRIVKEGDKQFSIGVQKKDSSFLTNIYTDSAQYVQPGRKILKGKDEIAKDWGGFLKLKENPIDLILLPETVAGNREIIYETGYGYTLLADSAKWNFSYVNVWRLLKDGSYKLEIDTYSPL